VHAREDLRQSSNSGSGSLDRAVDIEGELQGISRLADWKTMASAAAGAILGVPFVPSGTIRAAWAEVAQWVAGLQK